MSKTVFVDVKSIDWDLGDYEEFDENGNIVEEPDYDLPNTLKEVELTIQDYTENTPLEELDDGYIEEVLMDGLTEEYGFCINFIEWEYTKYLIIWEKDKHIVKDLSTNEVLQTYDTVEEAKRFVDTLQNLTNKN